MLSIKFLPVVLIFSANSLFAQVQDSNRIKVLRLNKVGKEFTYHNQDSTITYLKFLGTLKSDHGIKFKIMTSVWVWGISHRSTNRILIFSNANRYVGNYFVTTSDDLPTYIQRNKLIFKNIGTNCDHSVKTYIDFSNGIPRQFFRKCKGAYGDIYSFEKD